LLWDDRTINISNVSIGIFSISQYIEIIGSDVSYNLTTVYRRTHHNLKEAFYIDVITSKPTPGTRWLVTGDFNQIYRSRDKTAEI
jgi:hypothetical protein